jgi:hypothetical protein
LTCIWRGVQSPATGCTWLSISPGARLCLGIDDRRSIVEIDPCLADKEISVDRDQRVGIEDRTFERARQHQPDIADLSLACRRPGGWLASIAPRMR